MKKLIFLLITAIFASGLAMAAPAGPGGYLKIVNNSPSTLAKVSEHSYQMNSWNLPASVAGHSSIRSYIEFNWHIFKVHSDDAADTYYQVTCDKGTDTVHVFARVLVIGGVEFWRDVPMLYARQQGHNCVKLQTAEDNSIGWKHNGEVVLQIDGVGT